MDYWSAIWEYRFRYPQVRYLHSICRNRWNKSIPRVAILEFRPDRVVSPPLSSAEGLRDYLKSASQAGCQHRVFLVEDLDREIVDVLGSHFWIDPYLLACQCSTSFWANQSAYGRPVDSLSRQRDRLQSWNSGPSSPDTTHTPLSFTLRYLETLELRSDPLVWSMNSHDNFGRELRWDKLDRRDLVFYVRRNASFWTRKTHHGWDTIIFTEPPVKVGDPSAPYQPYQHGYYDVAPWPESHRQGQTQNRARGPFRKSLLDDLKFYWTQRATQREREAAINDPRMCAHYMERIAIAQWNIALEYLWKKVCWCSRGVWKFEESWPEGRPVMVDGKTMRLEGKELYEFLRTQTARSSEWRRKVGFLIDWLQISLESLGIGRVASTEQMESLNNDDNPLSDYNTDFLLVLQKLKDYRAELESTLAAITGVSQMIQGGVSLDETSRATKLSVVGLIFIPLAYVSSLLSMAGDFQPGKSQFWIYFAVAIPLCVLMVLGWRLIDGSMSISHWGPRWFSPRYCKDRLRVMSKSKSTA